MAYAGLQPDVVEVNPLTKAELKSWSGDYRKVPIAKIDGQQVNGSDEILNALLDHPYVVSKLEQKWQPIDVMTMKKFRLSESATRWLQFAKEDLAVLMYANISQSLTEAFKAFDYVRGTKTFSPVQKIAIRGVAPLAMRFASSKIKSKRGITDEREALNQILDTWEVEGLGNGTRNFSSGLASPNLGDIAVFGTLRAVEGLPAHDRAISERGGAIKEWYDRMRIELVDTV